MTAENLAKGMGYDNLKEEGIYTENSFGEMLKP
jgi:hypothetical protein